MLISIVDNNEKLGRIPNISLPPDKTCDFTCHFCYARRFYKWRENVRLAWEKNYSLYLQDKIAYFDEIDRYVKRKNPKFFRYHVGGDIVDRDYLSQMVDVALKNRNTIFVAYTKKVSLILEYTGEFPDNLILFLSTHPENFLSDVEFPRKTWIKGLKIPTYNEIVEDRLKRKVAVICPATTTQGKRLITCYKCKICYRPEIKKEIIFNYH